MRSILSIIALVCLVGCGTTRINTSQADGLKLEIVDVPLAVKFTNTGTESVQILKPLDGSESCLVMPYYKLVVTDTQGKEIRRSPPWCGNMDLWGDMKWPDDYLIIIPAGGTYSHPLRPNDDIPVTGTYKLRFYYIFEPTDKWVFGKRYPKHLWRGEASSNTIEMHLAVAQNK